MTHNEKRTVWWKEGIIGAFLGLQYGIISVAIGHPFDTVKTRMQAVEEFQTLKFRQAVRKLYDSKGFKGFYKGGLSIVMGSSFFRMGQYSGFEACYSRFEPQNLKNESWEKFFLIKIPYAFGLETRTVFAGIISGICRYLLECPFEYVKIKRQVDKFSWKTKDFYHGFGPLILKNSLMVSIGFCIIDILRRNTNAWSNSFTVFLATGFSTIVCHLVIWPIEIFRTLYMAKSKGEVGVSNFNRIMRENINLHGVLGGYFRGALPGICSIFLRNGIAMVLFLKLQRLISELGLRG